MCVRYTHTYTHVCMRYTHTHTHMQQLPVYACLEHFILPIMCFILTTYYLPRTIPSYYLLFTTYYRLRNTPKHRPLSSAFTLLPTLLPTIDHVLSATKQDETQTVIIRVHFLLGNSEGVFRRQAASLEQLLLLSLLQHEVL